MTALPGEPSTGVGGRSGKADTGKVFTIGATRITSGATVGTLTLPCESPNRNKSAATWPMRCTPSSSTT
ncbi:Uncharacterised protein [Mycobacterium tuberculosis]|nr:Uncharacterised protein [Mycobacterium tuberculosis]CNZ92228.1 Uncharacterised protein [Mycobacterium tuberculosis]